jgi:hypothetical protein
LTLDFTHRVASVAGTCFPGEDCCPFNPFSPARRGLLRSGSSFGACRDLVFLSCRCASMRARSLWTPDSRLLRTLGGLSCYHNKKCIRTFASLLWNPGLSRSFKRMMTRLSQDTDCKHKLVKCSCYQMQRIRPFHTRFMILDARGALRRRHGSKLPSFKRVTGSVHPKECSVT